MKTVFRSRLFRLRLLWIIGSFIPALSACASVKPYQREQLSSPTMLMPSGGPEFAARNPFLSIAGEKYASSGKGAGSAACATCSK